MERKACLVGCVRFVSDMEKRATSSSSGVEGQCGCTVLCSYIANQQKVLWNVLCKLP